MDLDEICIRRPTADDAPAMIAFMHRLTGAHDNNTSFDPGQFNCTEEQQRAHIAGVQDSNKTICLVSEHRGRIIAITELARERRVTRSHVAVLGISIDLDYRHRGLGTKLMGLVLDWARAQRIKRIELKVFARNEPAIKLFRKFDFLEEGRHAGAFCKEGRYIDDVTMALLLG